TPFHAVLLNIDSGDVDTSVGIDVAADPVLYNTSLIALTIDPKSSNDALLRERGFTACLACPPPATQLQVALSRIWHAQIMAPSPLPALPAAAVETAPNGATGQQKPRVLVAEDNSVNQIIVVRLLEKAGLKADVVSNGSEAVAAIANTVY